MADKIDSTFRPRPSAGGFANSHITINKLENGKYQAINDYGDTAEGNNYEDAAQRLQDITFARDMQGGF